MLRIKRHSVSTEPENVPLTRVIVDARLQLFAADVTIRQVFRNEESTPIEAVYCFPIEEQAAIYAFVAHIGDRQIVAQLKEKEDAHRQYTDALREGHGAFLLEQDQKSEDNFIINVGALLAGEKCQIWISYVTELDLIENGRKIRFVVPTTIAPRYNPERGGITAPANTTSRYVQTSPYSIKFRCQVDKRDVRRVSSISHPIEVDLSEVDAYLITFAEKKSCLDRDILIDIDLSENRSNTIVAVEPGAVMASFTPTEEECRRAMNNVETTNEFIFVVDCSGSMESEGKIGLARQAMLLFLKSLPINCHFNIVRFGSTYKTLFPEITAVYNEKNVHKAERLINRMRANLGGTELLCPLQWLDERPPAHDRSRQIFFLTDGEISNVEEVLDLCRSMGTTSRIFSFGLGQSPSRSLVKGLARATNGRFVFIPPGSDIDVYVGEQLQKALQRCVTDVQIQWNLGTAVTSVPEKIPPIYANDRLILYALANQSAIFFNADSHLELYTDNYRFGRVNITRVPQMSSNGLITRLAAKAMIQQLQHSKLPGTNNFGSLQRRFETQTPLATNTIATFTDHKAEMKRRIIQLSLKHQILSPYTAFVGVEKRRNGNNAGMVLREVPIQISADDQHLGKTQAPYSRSSNPPMVDSRIVNNLERQLSSLMGMDLNGSGYIGGHAGVYLRDVSPYAFRYYQQSRDISDTWPIGDENVVRYLVVKQKFDGQWELDDSHIQHLTGKSVTSFSSSTDHHLLLTAVVIVTLETRFASFSTLWFGVVQKARQWLLDSLGNDRNRLDSLLKKIRRRL